jgi:hypothetical protein
MYIEPIDGNEHLTDVIHEFKLARKLQYEHEWDENSEQADFYRQRATYYGKLKDEGVLYDPKF